MRVKKCSEAGCRIMLADNRETPSRCPEHYRAPFQTASRANEVLYATPEWRALSRQLIAGSVCANCGSDSQLSVHHIQPPRGSSQLFFAIDNCVVLCRCCHQRETNKEIRSRH